MHAILDDYSAAPISDAEKGLFKFIAKVNRTSNQITREDVEEARRAGWSDEALFDAISVCALFNFYNRWCDAAGVQDMPAPGYEMSGRRLATEDTSSVAQYCARRTLDLSVTHSRRPSWKPI